MIEFKLSVYCEINSHKPIDTKIAIRFFIPYCNFNKFCKDVFTGFYRLPVIPWPGIPEPDQWHWK